MNRIKLNQLIKMTSPLKIQHDQQRKFFYIDYQDSKEVTHLDYRLIDDKTIEYYHTFNPKIPSAKGKAKEIVFHGLEYAKQNDYKVIPSCWYVEKVIHENLEKYKNLLVESKL